jgi:hypothetical protein
MRVCKHYLNLQVEALLGVPIIIKCANFLILMCDLLQRHIYQQIVRELLSIWIPDESDKIKIRYI